MLHIPKICTTLAKMLIEVSNLINYVINKKNTELTHFYMTFFTKQTCNMYISKIFLNIETGTYYPIF